MDILDTSTDKHIDFILGKIKVLLLSINYPFAIKSYFETALRKRPDIDLKTCGPFTGSWIPWMGGMILDAKYSKSPDVPFPKEMIGQKVNYEIVKSMLNGWVPDLVLNIDAGCNWLSKPTDGYVVTVATDPHVLDYSWPRSYSDKFFNMQKIYSKPNDIYLPYAYSPEYHFPDDTVSKDMDAVLIGMPYPNRVEWIKEIRKQEISVLFENGPIFDDARKRYNRGRIGLNWSSLNDLNARAFEICAMKLYPIMNYVPDMTDFDVFSGFPTFMNIHDTIEQIVWAKNNPEKAQETAQLAYNNVQGQTYDSRIESILSECKFM